MDCPLTKIGIAIVEQNGLFLVGTRDEDRPLAGYAEFPGGKCLDNETPKECTVRECKEETGMEVTCHTLLEQTIHKYDHGTLELHFWLCTLNQPVTPLLAPAGNFQWVEKKNLPSLNFPEANRLVIQQLLKRN